MTEHSYETQRTSAFSPTPATPKHNPFAPRPFTAPNYESTAPAQSSSVDLQTKADQAQPISHWRFDAAPEVQAQRIAGATIPATPAQIPFALHQGQDQVRGNIVQRTVDSAVDALWEKLQGKRPTRFDLNKRFLAEHGLSDTDKPQIHKDYQARIAAAVTEARKNATGVATKAEVARVLTGNSGGQSYYPSGQQYPHVSVEWEFIDKAHENLRIKKIHVTLRPTGERYWWAGFSSGKADFSGVSGDVSAFKQGDKQAAQALVNDLIIPLHINPEDIPAAAPG